MKSLNTFRTGMVAALLVGPGCRSALPTYPALSGQEALAIMRERNGQIVYMSSPCRVVLADEEGRSVELHGALVAARDGKLRLRAWKLSRPVYDLTITLDGAWIWEPDMQEVGVPPRLLLGSSWTDGSAADYFQNFWAVTVGDFDQTWELIAADPETLLIRKHNSVGGSLECSVGTQTLTVQSCHFSAGSSVAEIRLSEYRRFGQRVIPTRIDALAEGRGLTMFLDDPALDEEPAPQAFIPPTGAVSLR